MTTPPTSQIARERAAGRELQRVVQFSPAFDRRHTDPSKNYGIHGVELRMVLKGRDGAVQFLVFTNWHLPHVQREQAAKAARGGSQYVDDARGIELAFCPMGADVGYHSPHPQYEGQSSMGPCEYLGGRPCFYDGSGLAAERMLAVLIAEGGEAAWKQLEERYDELFPTPLGSEGVDCG